MTTVFLADDVVDLTPEEGVRLVEKTVLAEVIAGWATRRRSSALTWLLMREMFARPGFGEAHAMLELEVVVELRALRVVQRLGLLLVDQVGDAVPRLLGCR